MSRSKNESHDDGHTFGDLDTNDDFPLPAGGEDDFGGMPVPPSRSSKAAEPEAEHFPVDEEEEDSASRYKALRAKRRAAEMAEPEPEEDFGFADRAEGDGYASDEGHPHLSADDGHVDDGEFEPVEDGGEGEFEADEPHADAEPDGKAPGRVFGLDKGKLVTFGAAAAVVVFVLGVGYQYVGGMFTSVPVVAAAPPSPLGAPQPNRFAGGPGAGMPQGFGQANGVGIPQGLGQRPAQPGAAMAMPTLPGGGGAQPVGQNVVMKGPSAGLGMPTPPGAPAAAPPIPNAFDASPMPASSMPPPAAMRQAPAASAQDAAMAERLERLERKLDQMASVPHDTAPSVGGDVEMKLASLEQRLSGVESRAVAPTTPRPNLEPPAKPRVIADWTLKGVQNGVAWLAGPQGFKEARKGDDLGSAGHVKSISQYDHDWVVMTENGIILRK